MRKLSAPALSVLVAVVGAVGFQGTAQDPAGTPAYETAWTKPIDAEKPVNLAVAAGVLILTGEDTAVSARSLDDGRELWTAPLRASSPPAVVDASLGIITADRIHVLDTQSGSTTWSAALPEGTRWIDGAVGRFLTTAGEDLTAWSPTGDVAWRAGLGSAVVDAIPDARGGLVAVTAAPALVGLEATQGAVQWRSPLPSPSQGPTAFSDRLYFGGADGALYSYRINRAARQAWRFQIIDAVGRPAVDDRHVYFTLIDNSLRAFERKGGSQRWSRLLPSRAAMGPVRTTTGVTVVLTTGTVLTYPLSAGGKAPGLPSTTDVVNGMKTRVQSLVVSRDTQWIVTVTVAEDGVRRITALRRRVDAGDHRAAAD